MTIRARVAICSVLGLTLPVAWGCAEEPRPSSSSKATATPVSAPASAAPLPTPAELMREVAQAYRSAPAFTDRMRVEVRTPRGSIVDEAFVTFGAGSSAQVGMDGYVFTADGDQLIVQRSDMPHKYYARSLDGDIVSGYRALSNGMAIPVPQAALRYAGTETDLADALGMSRVTGLRPTGVQRVRRDGRDWEELALKGEGGGTVKAQVDPETRFIGRLEVESPQIRLAVDMTPKRHDRLPEPIGVDLAGKRRAATVGGLGQLEQGDPAPDFELTTLDGRNVSLDEMRGSIVVLDFWATWCGPCRMGLPKLEELHKWAGQVDLPVRVYPVNIGERVAGNEAKDQLVSKYWNGQEFTMATLMDYDGAVARSFRVGPIPHTVVIDPNGTVADVVVGYNAAHTELIKELARTEFRGGA